jgi:hypothetical protein
MARFKPAGAYHAPEKSVRLLPFRFDRTSSDGYLVSNMVGDFVRLSADEFDRLIGERITPGDDLYEKAYASNLITRDRLPNFKYSQHACAAGWHICARRQVCTCLSSRSGVNIHVRIAKSLGRVQIALAST